MPLVLPPTVLGFYLLVALGPEGIGGPIAGLWGGRTLAFTFQGLVIGSRVLFAALRGAADPQCLPGHGRSTARGSCDAARVASAGVLDSGRAVGASRIPHRCRARFRPYRW